jgi:hypothetical protein
VSDTVVWGMVDEQQITFPMEVPVFNGLNLLYTVPLDIAQGLVPHESFRVLETSAGHAQLIIAVCDYLDNPWGDYNEINFGFLVRPRGAGDEVFGSFIYRMPVNQAFTCKAGNRVMGFPKTVETIDIAYTDSTVSIGLVCDGATAMSIEVPRVVSPGTAERTETICYSYLEGEPYGTELAIEMGTGLIDPSAVHLELGSGAIAAELQSLGLPRAADAAIWGEGLAATFYLGEPVVGA